MLTAITRAVSSSLAHCQLTHLPRQTIDLEKARRQHAAYEDALRQLGVQVVRVRDEPDMPDAVFVEDTAVVADELAIMSYPGAASRRGEVAGVADVLARYRQLAWIEPPGTLDGGDVLRLGKRLYVGLSSRSNHAGIEQLRRHVAAWNYDVRAVEVHGCLHLKSAVTQVADGLLLINPAWIRKNDLAEFEFIEVAAEEPYAANALLIDGRVVYGMQFPRTRDRLQRHGISVVCLDATELAKAEGAMTCCCVLVPNSHSEALSS
jgi:dimethylargininase